MIRVMLTVLGIVIVPVRAGAQTEAQHSCADVAKDIDRYADQQVTFHGKINSIEIRDGVVVMVFACVTPQGEVIPDAFFGITVAAGTESFTGTQRGTLSEVMIVSGVVRGSDALKVFRNPPAFRGPYLYTPKFKPVG